jgi:hypothetical protein
MVGIAIATLSVGTLWFVIFGCAVAIGKMLASCLSATNCALQIVANGVAGAEFCNAFVSSFAAIVAALVHDILGISVLEGKKLTMSDILS